MPGAEAVTTLMIEIICGATGGMAIGRWARGISLGARTNAFVGAAGGLALAWLAGWVPGVGRFVTHVETAVDATTRSVGGLTPAVIIGVGIAGLLGGAFLTATAGFVKNRVGAA